MLCASDIRRDTALRAATERRAALPLSFMCERMRWTTESALFSARTTTRDPACNETATSPGACEPSRTALSSWSRSGDVCSWWKGAPASSAAASSPPPSSAAGRAVVVIGAGAISRVLIARVVRVDAWLGAPRSGAPEEEEADASGRIPPPSAGSRGW